MSTWNSRLILSKLLLLGLFLAVGCSKESSNLPSTAGDLRWIYMKWAEAGRPSPNHFNINDYMTFVGGPSLFFYTNVVSTRKGLLHCRFAERDQRNFHGSGILVITDEGVLLWIRDSDKQATIVSTQN